jgi:hypothetical protein
MLKFLFWLLVILAIIFLLAMLIPVQAVQPMPEGVEFPTEGWEWFKQWFAK